MDPPLCHPTGKRAFHIQLWIAFSIYMHVVYIAYIVWMNGCVHKKHTYFYLRTEHLQLAIPAKETLFRVSEVLGNGSSKGCQNLNQKKNYFSCFNMILVSCTENWILLATNSRHTYPQARLEKNMPQQQGKFFIWRQKLDCPTYLIMYKMGFF